ncbi:MULTISPECIES: hypothetical protein [Oleiagrimonas]|jgi:uncharacterized membrane protein|uniref:Transmembrane protein n=1 Tax=Oleiagrimonas citrea TaxID=1665687 RepID=A0A846ZK30_9GAMM|nr:MULTISPECIES: hypothetical protein [Oleiagrimonas]NKZ38336.1 hypothetical protein [Oleiagrimonas citrea]RAP58376.1 hypothetical protein BTJ49_05355 [Oleiagrimonas sp. MCCC 1A03011]
MEYLGLILLGPWLLILAWAYWRFPKSLPRTVGRRLFDAGVLIAAIVVAYALTRYGFMAAADPARPGRVGVWQMVAPVLYAYGGFSLVLFLGLWLRRMRWGRPSA